jgi:hypothetical protein
MTKNHLWPAPRIVLCLAFASFLGCAETGRMASPEPSVEQGAASQAIAEAPEAGEILMRMARFLANTQRFTVKMRDDYDVLQESGQKIEFGESRVISVDRPDGLRVEIEHSDGAKHLVLYDGKAITAFSPRENVYAQLSKTGGIDEAIMYFLRDLHMRLPLAMLLVSRFPEEIERRTQALDYVEKTEIDGTWAHHLAGRTETVDYQVWIDAGNRPLPLRVVLTYKDSEGQPQFRAHFSEWNLAPDIQESQFAFNPPEGARKIAFLAELPQAVLKGAAKLEQQGEQK